MVTASARLRQADRNHHGHQTRVPCLPGGGFRQSGGFNLRGKTLLPLASGDQNHPCRLINDRITRDISAALFRQ
jgi:hypothetical protein